MTLSETTPEVRTPRTTVAGRPTVRGKFLFLGGEKFRVRGINVVRVYTAPPPWLLDAALKHGLRVMIGLNWGEHMAFLDEPGRIAEIEERIRTWIRSCAGHPAVLCYIIGNEIPASIVRWHGRRRVEKFIERLYRIAKEEDPDAL